MKKINLLGMLIFSFILESCSYSSPKEAYESNVIGKNGLQKTNATVSRRYPDGNKPSENNYSTSSERTNFKKNANDYDAYQHYQAAKPPKKAKRRPILNLKELNDLMDREATITITERKKSDNKPYIDENSNIQEVIEYNKTQKSNKKRKKKVKVLVVKKDENSSNQVAESTKKVAANSAAAKIASKRATANKAIVSTSSKNKNESITADNNKTNKTEVKQVAINSKSNASSTSEITKLPEPNIAIPPVTTSNSVATPITSEIPPIADNKVATETTSKVEENKIVPETAVNAETASPVNTEIPTPMNPVDLSTDTSNMTQQELEQHLKAKFNSENSNPDNANNNIDNNSIDQNDNSSDLLDSQPNIPLPAIPSANNSIFGNSISHINEIFITYYYKVKLLIMNFISSLFGFNW